MATDDEARQFFESLMGNFDTSCPLRWSFVLGRVSEGKLGPLMQDVMAMGFAEVDPDPDDELDDVYDLYFAEVCVHDADTFARRVVEVQELATRKRLTLVDFSAGDPDA